MNCDADKLATSFCECMDQREVMSIQEGFFTLSSNVCLSVNGKHMSLNFQHSICQHIQGSKHHQHLQWKHGQDNVMWNSINWATMKGSYLSLGPLKWIKTSKHIHGWLNTGWQKSKISPDAIDAHKCPCCQEANKTQEHILLCPAGSDIANNMNSYILCPRILYEIKPVKSNNCSSGASGHG